MTATGSSNQALTGNQGVDGLLSTFKWNATTIDYNFPTSSGYYPVNYNGTNNEPAGFLAASSSFQTMVREALDLYEAFTNLDFTQVAATDASNTSIARTSQLGSSNGHQFNGFGYFPGSSARAGDAWFSNANADVGDTYPFSLGRGTFRLVLHELGHTLGLKHPHESSGGNAILMPTELDFGDYSIMSYRRYEGGPTSGNSEAFGRPQTPMMYDIVALQTMYGANYGHNSSDTTYRWDPTTGQMFVNGVGGDIPGGGAAGANRIYMTLWDGNGNDTFDLTNYTTALNVDLAPGGKSTFSQPQLAVVDPAMGIRATGNVFNSLLFQSDPRSLIENVLGGSGNDTLTGNIAANTLNGGLGTDTLNGLAGNDTLFGGAGLDTLNGGDDSDTLVGNADVFASEQDTLNGGNGDDTIHAEASDIINGGAGRDFLYLVNDNAITINLGATGIEWITTLFGNDVIDGSTQAVGIEVYSNGGNDIITGSALGDIIWSGSGNNTMTGGAGNDTLVGDVGSDSLSGGNDNDTLFVDPGDSLIDGGAGFDNAYITSGAGITLDLATTQLEWVADFVNGNDTLDGAGVSANLEIYAAGGTDTVTGGSGGDFMWGGSGNDTLTGNGGNDVLVGQTGADRLTGGLGTDALYGNSGNGGDTELDTFVFGNGWGTDFVFDFEHNVDKLDLTGVTGLNDFSQLSLTNTPDGHCYVTFDGNLIALANRAGQITQSDFMI